MISRLLLNVKSSFSRVSYGTLIEFSMDPDRKPLLGSGAVPIKRPSERASIIEQ